jgi:hypothetical protein
MLATRSGSVASWRLHLVALFACVLGGCRSEPPKSIEQLYTDERQLPGLYLTAETNARVIAPIEKGAFVDEKTGELCWPAKVCTNPDCPGRGPAGEPFLFITPITGVVANADGTVGYDASKEQTPDNYYGNCPQCLKKRNLPAEDDAVRKKYADFVQLYVLPETEKLRKEFAEKRQARVKELQERMQRKPDA